MGNGGNKTPNPDTDVYLTFDLDIRASHLWYPFYSSYQQFLYQTILDHRKKGWTFQQIADWLNENDYLTVRGKTFRGNHVHSIVKKKRIRDERLNQEHQSELSNFQLRFIDMTLINQL